MIKLSQYLWAVRLYFWTLILYYLMVLWHTANVPYIVVHMPNFVITLLGGLWDILFSHWPKLIIGLRPLFLPTWLHLVLQGYSTLEERISAYRLWLKIWPLLIILPLGLLAESLKYLICRTRSP